MTTTDISKQTKTNYYAYIICTQISTQLFLPSNERKLII